MISSSLSLTVTVDAAFRNPHLSCSWKSFVVMSSILYKYLPATVKATKHRTPRTCMNIIVDKLMEDE